MLEAEAVPVDLAGGLARGAADLLGRALAELVRAVAPAAEVRCSTRRRCSARRCSGSTAWRPGDHAAADRLRPAIVAWDKGLRSAT